MPNDVYLGNPLLKKANTPIEFTQEQVLEFVKCKDDPVYFCKKLCKNCYSRSRFTIFPDVPVPRETCKTIS